MTTPLHALTPRSAFLRACEEEGEAEPTGSVLYPISLCLVNRNTHIYISTPPPFHSSPFHESNSLIITQTNQPSILQSCPPTIPRNNDSTTQLPNPQQQQQKQQPHPFQNEHLIPPLHMHGTRLAMHLHHRPSHRQSMSHRLRYRSWSKQNQIPFDVFFSGEY